MSLLDINETKSQLDELNYLLYDNFVDYLSKHVPRPLWDHSIYGNRAWCKVNYIRFISTFRTDQQNVIYNDNINIGILTSKEHTCIHITPTDDEMVNIEIPKIIYPTFPILINKNEQIPKTIMKILEPIGNKLEIIEGCLLDPLGNNLKIIEGSL